MFIHRLKVSGLLSFGPEGIDLPLQPINVLIGANGSGKSNLLDVLSLLKAAPRRLTQPIDAKGGIKEWLWKGNGSDRRAIVDAVVDFPRGGVSLNHVMEFTERLGRLEIVMESIEDETPDEHGSDSSFYHFKGKRAVLRSTLRSPRTGLRTIPRKALRAEESILSQIRDPNSHPALNWLQDRYQEIAIFRDWSFSTSLRQPQSSQGLSDFLDESGQNAGLIFESFNRQTQYDFLSQLQELYANINHVRFKVEQGNLRLLVEEVGGRVIPGTHLSDGTLHYICLLLVLLHPSPPPLVVIEEPEIGLHPDAIPALANLLVEASQRTQLIITTHSSMLIDALPEPASRVVVCEKEDGVSRFERLDPGELRDWLGIYSLSELWSMGKIGGNRW